jgi:hypothetical protein
MLKVWDLYSWNSKFKKLGRGGDVLQRKRLHEGSGGTSDLVLDRVAKAFKPRSTH